MALDRRGPRATGASSRCDSSENSSNAEGSKRHAVVARGGLNSSSSLSKVIAPPDGCLGVQNHVLVGGEQSRIDMKPVPMVLRVPMLTSACATARRMLAPSERKLAGW